ncbi:hypothetical protein [Janthinobacterium sp. 61]|uniref:hypothetical protein n=1 Tax=Janthinobacterium sp. 61 TaxID=2035209 RepID=UPI001179F5B9|nr:hypothetical protein [Janthinobacterium sp. 61]
MTLARGLAWIAVPPQGPARTGGGKEGRAISVALRIGIIINIDDICYIIKRTHQKSAGRPEAAHWLAFCDNAGLIKYFPY